MEDYMKKEELLRSIQGKMIVSCQAVYGEPLYVEEKSVMYLMARAAKMAGSPAIRTSGIRDILAIKEETGLNSYNFATQQQPLWISYYYMKESLKYQKPKYFLRDLKLHHYQTALHILYMVHF